MSLPQVIGFSGKAGAGKTSVAMEASVAGYCRLSFADPLRDMLRALGLTTHDLSKGKEQPHALLGGKTPRFALQKLGTEWGRDTIYSDLWIGVARHRLLMALDAGERVCFDDVRFENEARMIRSLGGIIVEIHRPGQPQLAPAHASETGLPTELIDHHLSACDLVELKTKLYALLSSLVDSEPLPIRP